jgi:hypothetical protein
MVFQCTAQQLLQINPAADSYLQQEGVDLHLVSTSLSNASSMLVYSLIAPLADANALDLLDRPALHLKEEPFEKYFSALRQFQCDSLPTAGESGFSKLARTM